MDTSASVLRMLSFIICVSNTCVWSMTWTASTNPIPEFSDTAYHGLYIAYYNETVQILGGGSFAKDIIAFTLDFSSILVTNTSLQITGQYAQSSTQIKHKLWGMLLSNPNTLSAFDLNKQSFTETIVYPGMASWDSCVTNYYNEYILVLGGLDQDYNFQKDFNIYNISNNSWSVGTELEYVKRYHSCNVVNSQLFVIGGFNKGSIDTVDVLHISQSFHSSWTTMSDTLSEGR
eukprot:357078_1